MSKVQVRFYARGEAPVASIITESGQQLYCTGKTSIERITKLISLLTILEKGLVVSPYQFA